MSAPWQQVLANVGALNNAQAPFSYWVDGDAIVGYWDVAKITSLGIASADSFDKEYRLVVKPTADGVVDFTEYHQQTEASAGAGGASMEKSFFKGKSMQKSFGMTISLGGSNKGEPTNVAGYAFDTAAIKDPLLAMLKHFGWEPKRGLFGRLFG